MELMMELRDVDNGADTDDNDDKGNNGWTDENEEVGVAGKK